MRRFIFPIIKKRKEEREQKDNRIPLYREHSDVEPPAKRKPLMPKDEYVEIDFDIDQFDIKNEIKL